MLNYYMAKKEKTDSLTKSINKNLNKISMLYSKLETQVCKVFLSPKENSRAIGYAQDLPYDSDKKNDLLKYDMYTPKHIFATSLKHHKMKKPILYKSYSLLGKSETIKHDKNKKFPAIFFIHGGSWTSGDKSLFYPLCSTLSSTGYIVYALNYRLLPSVTIDTCYHDSLSAIKFILKKYHSTLDLNRIILCGDSAGAMLSSLITCNVNNGDEKLPFGTTIKADILFYGVYNLHNLKKVDFAGLKQVYQYTKLSSDNTSTILDEYSPISKVTSAFPKTFISAGQVDKLYDETVSFISTLYHNNIDVTPLIFDSERIDGAHAFMNVPLAKSYKQNIIAIKKFLKTL